MCPCVRRLRLGGKEDLPGTVYTALACMFVGTWLLGENVGLVGEVGTV